MEVSSIRPAFPAKPSWKRLLVLSIAGALFAAAVLVSGGRDGRTAPRSDILPLVVTATTGSLLGETTILTTGWMQVSAEASSSNDGVEVLALEIEALRLAGASPLGRVTVEEPADGLVSTGEVRGLGQVPASGFIDLFVSAEAPDSPIGSLTFANHDALRLVASTALETWPPRGAAYRLAATFGVDNDGDGAVDEDTADDDRDGFYDEDRPGPDPDTAGWDECGDDADCDGLDGEDPPAALCSRAACDGDSDGLVDEDLSCRPLFGPEGTHLKLGLCIRDLTLEVAPALPSYSVGRGGPSQLDPADVLGLVPEAPGPDAQPPFVRIRCEALGLMADGCDGGGDGDQDNIDAFSFGHDITADSDVLFSVGPGAQGAPGSAVAMQSACPPTLPGEAPEPEPDVFRSEHEGANELLLDGNGPVGSCAPAFPLGLVESAGARDDLDALDSSDSAIVDANGDGVPEAPVYFSLDAGSPSLVNLGRSPADVLVSSGRQPAEVYASAKALGLSVDDDIDALCLREDGDGRFGNEDAAVFSLRSGSPTLRRLGAGPGDLLTARPPRAVLAGRRLGLSANDEIDALSCGSLAMHRAREGDVTCDGCANSVDAAVILQYDAGLKISFRCPEGADITADGMVNGVDAAVVLSLEAGLLDRESLLDTHPHDPAFMPR